MNIKGEKDILCILRVRRILVYVKSEKDICILRVRNSHLCIKGEKDICILRVKKRCVY